MVTRRQALPLRGRGRQAEGRAAFLVNVSGGGLRRLVLQSKSPRFSSDGTAVAVIRNSKRLVIAPANGGSTRTLPQPNAGFVNALDW
jgi:hypothetical protein